MNELGDLIREMIAAEGPMPLERYMALALTHPRLGYYMTRDPLGAAGDFTTAPEISQMFGELLGVWCVDYWTRMGKPDPLRLIELGAGRGTLMADALRAARVAPDFLKALDVHLVEISPTLRAAQHARLADIGAPVSWSETFAATPPGPAIIIANEFFDALPVHHYVKTDDGWRERVVGLDPTGQLAFGLAFDVEPAHGVNALSDAIIEIGAAGQRVMTEIAARIVADGGAALIIDYGHGETGLGETLQAVRSHAYADPLDEPGEADLTTHVDFDALARMARAASARIFGPTPQGEFLTRLGVFERAAILRGKADAAGKATIEAALSRLVSSATTVPGGRDGGMGELFKVLAVTRHGAPVPAGFEEKAPAP